MYLILPNDFCPNSKSLSIFFIYNFTKTILYKNIGKNKSYYREIYKHWFIPPAVYNICAVPDSELSAETFSIRVLHC